MTNKQKGTTAIVIVIILLIIFLWHYFKSKKQKEKCPDGRDIPASGNCADNPIKVDGTGSTIVTPLPLPDVNNCVTPSSYIVNSFPLSVGMKGTFVSQLQAVLNSDFDSNLSTDGYFGCLTLAAVKKAFGVETVDAELFKNAVQKIVPILP